MANRCGKDWQDSLLTGYSLGGESKELIEGCLRISFDVSMQVAVTWWFSPLEPEEYG